MRATVSKTLFVGPGAAILIGAEVNSEMENAAPEWGYPKAKKGEKTAGEKQRLGNAQVRSHPAALVL
jgi:hypothetical protein